MFFPDPEVPYAPENFLPISVEGALVFQVSTSDRIEVAVAAIISREGKDYLYRFTLPRHSKAIRQIFRRSGVRDVPWDRETFNIEGLVVLNFEGTVIGEDRIREDLETKPAGAFVVKDVKILK